MPLTPADQYVRDTTRLWAAREARQRTGVACPTVVGDEPCGRELLRARPPQYTKDDSPGVWVKTHCPKCGRTVWLPE